MPDYFVADIQQTEPTSAVVKDTASYINIQSPSPRKDGNASHRGLNIEQLERNAAVREIRRKSVQDGAGSTDYFGEKGGGKKMETVHEEQVSAVSRSSDDSEAGGRNRLLDGTGAKKERDLTPEPVLPSGQGKKGQLNRELHLVKQHPRKSEEPLQKMDAINFLKKEITGNALPVKKVEHNSKSQMLSEKKSTHDSGQGVTAMLEDIEKQGTLNPSMSYSNPTGMNNASTPPVMRGREDRGFTIHDIGKHGPHALEKKNASGIPLGQRREGNYDKEPAAGQGQVNYQGYPPHIRFAAQQQEAFGAGDGPRYAQATLMKQDSHPFIHDPAT